jgi:Fibronectin type III domain
MNNNNKLLSIGKLSIATMLFLATYMKVAKAADPIAPLVVPNAFVPPTDLQAVMGPNNQYIQINWIDNTLNESNFQVRVFREANPGNQSIFNVAPAPGRGTRAFANIGDLQPGSYMYRVCVQRPGAVTCNPLARSFNIPQAANPPANFPANFPPPTNVSATRVGAGAARISWNHPGVAQSFRVDIRLPGNNNFTQAAVVNGSLRQADISPLFINTNYPVRVCGRTGAAPQEVCSPTINVVLP